MDKDRQDEIEGKVRVYAKAASTLMEAGRADLAEVALKKAEDLTELLRYSRGMDWWETFAKIRRIGK